MLQCFPRCLCLVCRALLLSHRRRCSASRHPLGAMDGWPTLLSHHCCMPTKCMNARLQIIRAGTKLKLIGRAGAGVDNIDTVAATRKGVIVMNTPGGNTSAAAELTLSLLMNAARQIPAACAALKGGVWDRKTYSKGVELKGKTIGIVGLGMIGNEVARRCQALDMTTIGFDPLVTEERAAADGIKKVSLEALYAAADIITVHTPLNDATRNLLNKATLAKCKKGVIVINAARGGIVNEADLLAALESGHVGAAGIDVWEQEPPNATSKALIAHPRVRHCHCQSCAAHTCACVCVCSVCLNIICLTHVCMYITLVCSPSFAFPVRVQVLGTPHLGASTEEAQKKVAREIAQQMSDAFAAKGYVGVVNASHLALAHQPTLVPFVKLAEALGRYVCGLTLARRARVLLACECRC